MRLFAKPKRILPPNLFTEMCESVTDLLLLPVVSVKKVQEFSGFMHPNDFIHPSQSIFNS